MVPGMPIAERTPDAEPVDAGPLTGPARGRSDGADGAMSSAPGGSLVSPRKEHGAGPEESRPNARAPMAVRNASSLAPLDQDRRHAPVPGGWWVGGGERRGRLARRKPTARVAGTLLFESGGRWRAAAGERHQIVESNVAGVVCQARNAVEVTIRVDGVALAAAIAAGEPSRGYLDLPRLTDGELWANSLDVGRSGAVVVAGNRISAQAIGRARAMSIRGLIAGSVGQGELRDLEASENRQRASLVPSLPFGLLALDGYGRRPIATPILALLATMVGREVAIVTDPPLLVFDTSEVPLPELPPNWVRVRSGPHAGREGQWLEPAGLYRFRSGIHLEAAVVRFSNAMETTVIPVSDLERLVF